MKRVTLHDTFCEHNFFFVHMDFNGRRAASVFVCLPMPLCASHPRASYLSICMHQINLHAL